jgi:hypothetical protein
MPFFRFEEIINRWFSVISDTKKAAIQSRIEHLIPPKIAAHFVSNQRCEYPRQESNLYLEFRKPSFYPLNYGDVDGCLFPPVCWPFNLLDD